MAAITNLPGISRFLPKLIELSDRERDIYRLAITALWIGQGFSVVAIGCYGLFLISPTTSLLTGVIASLAGTLLYLSAARAFPLSALMEYAIRNRWNRLSMALLEFFCDHATVFWRGHGLRELSGKCQSLALETKNTPLFRALAQICHTEEASFQLALDSGDFSATVAAIVTWPEGEWIGDLDDLFNHRTSLLAQVARIDSRDEKQAAFALLKEFFGPAPFSQHILDFALWDDLDEAQLKTWISTNGKPKAEWFCDVSEDFTQKLVNAPYSDPLPDDVARSLFSKLIKGTKVATNRALPLLLSQDACLNLHWESLVEAYDRNAPWIGCLLTRMAESGVSFGRWLRLAESHLLQAKLAAILVSHQDAFRATVRDQEAPLGCLVSFIKLLDNARFFEIMQALPRGFIQEHLMDRLDQLDSQHVLDYLYKPRVAREVDRRLLKLWSQRPNFQKALRSGIQTDSKLLLRLLKRVSMHVQPVRYQLIQTIAECRSDPSWGHDFDGDDVVSTLEVVIEEGFWDLIEAWRKAGLSLNFQTDGSLETLLHRFVNTNDVEVVHRLARLGINTQLKNHQNHTPLGQALVDQRWQVALKLIPYEKSNPLGRFAVQVKRYKTLDSQLKTCHIDLQKAMAEMSKIDPEGAIEAIAATWQIDSSEFERQIMLHNIPIGRVNAWLRAVGLIHNTTEQITRISGELRELQEVLHMLARVGIVHEPGSNLVCDMIEAGVSADVIHTLVHHGGSIFARNERGQAPLQCAASSSQKVMRVLSRESGETGNSWERSTMHFSRLILESSYSQEIERQFLLFADFNWQAVAFQTRTHLAKLAVQRGSFEVFVWMLDNSGADFDFATEALQIGNYDRLALCADRGLVQDYHRLAILQKADMAALDAVGYGYPKEGSLEALCSSTNNLLDRLAMIGELKLSSKDGPRLAKFLLETLPEKDERLTQRDFKHYHSLLLNAWPSLPPITSAQELRRVLNELMVRSEDVQMALSTPTST